MEQTRNGDGILLAVVFAVYSCSTIVWALLDETPPPWDPSDHLRWAYDYYAGLSAWKFRAFLQDLFVAPHPYPPLVHLVTTTIFIGFGASRVTGIVVNLIMLLLLMVSLWRLGRELYPGQDVRFGTWTISAGAIAAMVAPSFHFSAWLMHDAFLDFPLAAMVAAGFLMLVRAGDFHDRGRAVTFGVAAGMGLLTKQTFAFFFLLPGIYTLASVLRARQRRAITNLFLAVTVAVLVAGLWYVPHADDVLEIYRINRLNAGVENEPPVLTRSSLLFYWMALVGPQPQIPLAIAFIAGSAWSLWRARRQSRTLYLWILSGILAFTFVANKDLRYTVPVLPAAALLSVAWLSSDHARNATKRAGAVVIAVTALVTFATAQWPGSWSPLLGNYFSFDHEPRGHDWGVRRTVEHIAREQREDRPRVGVVVNLPYVNPSNVAAYARLMSPEGTGPVMDIDWLTSDAALARLTECDYLVVRGEIEFARDVSPIEHAAQAWLVSNGHTLDLAAAFDLPPGYGRLNLYRRR